LVEVASIDRLRAMRSTELDIDITGEPPDLSHVDGVAQVARTPTGIRVTLNGPPGPVLKAIDSLPLTAVRSQEASLEEIFLAYYGDGDRA
jgi:ABC-2 type transport system ATP-binding protein